MIVLGCFERMFAKRSLSSLSLDELFQLQHDVGMAIAKKLNVRREDKP